MLKEPDLSKPSIHRFVAQLVKQGGYTGLFNGVRSDEWNSSNIAYFGGNGHFIELEIDDDSNFYRSGTTSWIASNENLSIYRYNTDGTYTNVTSLYTIPKVSCSEKQWALFAKGVPKGRYKFILENTVSYRLDSEWFIERINSIFFDNSVITFNGTNLNLGYDLRIETDRIITDSLITVIHKLYKQDGVTLIKTIELTADRPVTTVNIGTLPR